MTSVACPAEFIAYSQGRQLAPSYPSLSADCGYQFGDPRFPVILAYIQDIMEKRDCKNCYGSAVACCCITDRPLIYFNLFSCCAVFEFDPCSMHLILHIL